MRTGPHGAGAGQGEEGTLLFHPGHGSSMDKEPSLPELPGAGSQALIQRLAVGPLPSAQDYRGGLLGAHCFCSLHSSVSSGQRAPWGLRL